MKTLLLALSAPVVLLTATGGSAQTILPNPAPDIDQVANAHQIALCQQDWAEAERQVSVLMALPSVTSELRQELVFLRQQYVLYRANGTEFETVPGCAGVIIPAEPIIEDDVPLVPLGSGDNFINSFNNSFNGPPPPLSTLERSASGSIPTPPSETNAIVITGATAPPLTVTGVYHQGNVVYGTLVNNTGTTVSDVQILASLYDSSVGFAHAAQYTYDGVIFPGGRVEVPVTVEAVGLYGESGGILSSPVFEVWATGF